MPPEPPSPAHPVAHYYDRNTGRFLRFGGSGDILAIHRPLWAPGVRTAREAAAWSNRLVEDELRAGMHREPSLLVDLGCGVGGTCFHLAAAFPQARVEGVTISPRQVALARELAERGRVAERCRFHLGDFEGPLPDELPRGCADAVVAIESFVHARELERFLAGAAALLRPDGLLILIDDFLARPVGALDPAERRPIADFQAGWRLGSLCTPEELVTRAAPFGLAPQRTADLTSLLRLDRPRDRAIALLAPLLRRAGLVRVPFFANLIGGNGLRSGVRAGTLRYLALVLRREDRSGNPDDGAEFREDPGAHPSDPSPG